MDSLYSKIYKLFNEYAIDYYDEIEQRDSRKIDEDTFSNLINAIIKEVKNDKR